MKQWGPRGPIHFPYKHTHCPFLKQGDRGGGGNCGSSVQDQSTPKSVCTMPAGTMHNSDGSVDWLPLYLWPSEAAMGAQRHRFCKLA